MRSLFVVCLAILLSPNAFASRTFTLVDDASGTRYFCGQGGGGNGGAPIDPACVQQVGDYCRNNTNNTRDTCFDRATQACSSGRSGIASCVASAANYCRNNTNFTRDTCFDRAVQSCGGNFEAIREMAEAVKAKMKNDLELEFRL